jgi:hypothetical protein
MALLQRLESCQAFVDRDLSHASAFIPIPIALDDDDGIVAERLSMVSGQSAEWSQFDFLRPTMASSSFSRGCQEPVEERSVARI